MKKLVVVQIEANGRYCSDECQFMSADAKRCELFDRDLTWDWRKYTNGNSRLSQCRKAEHGDYDSNVIEKRR